MQRPPSLPFAASDSVQAALAFAAWAHGRIDQRRKFTGEPYVLHPIEVATLVHHHATHNDAMLQAALLHDVEEDTRISRDEIEKRFGEEVATLTGWLTNVSRPEDGNRAARKRLDREHGARAPGRAQTIKCADIISNARTIVSLAPEFAAVWLPEKRLALDGMRRADFVLLDMADDVINRGIAALRQRHREGTQA